MLFVDYPQYEPIPRMHFQDYDCDDDVDVVIDDANQEKEDLSESDEESYEGIM